MNDHINNPQQPAAISTDAAEEKMIVQDADNNNDAVGIGIAKHQFRLDSSAAADYIQMAESDTARRKEKLETSIRIMFKSVLYLTVALLLINFFTFLPPPVRKWAMALFGLAWSICLLAACIMCLLYRYDPSAGDQIFGLGYNY